MKQGLEVTAWAVWPLRAEKGDGEVADEGAGSERSVALENANDGSSRLGGAGSAISSAGAPGLPMAPAAMEASTSITAP
jgi:hypothetical protein